MCLRFLRCGSFAQANLIQQVAFSRSMRYVLPPYALPAAAPHDARCPLTALALSPCFGCRPLLSSRAAIRPTIFPWPPIAAGTGGARALQRKRRARRRMCCCRCRRTSLSVRLRVEGMLRKFRMFRMFGSSRTRSGGSRGGGRGTRRNLAGVGGLRAAEMVEEEAISLKEMALKRG